jgi:REP element-mobilizing transposase RayT
MLCQRVRLCKLCKLVKKIFQQILGRYSRLVIDNQSRALSVHFLCTLRMSNSISLMMQSLGRQYMLYFNVCYGRSGTLWEGRYKSCLVQAEDYLLHLYRYIELNPVRANMIEDLADYHWSRYQINGLGKESELCTPNISGAA